MSLRAHPPAVLSNARVVEFAYVEISVQFTGKLRLNVDGSWLGAVPNLAIGQDLETQELLLLHCDEHWNVMGVQAWNGQRDKAPRTSEEVKLRAEEFYRGLIQHWRRYAHADA